MLTVEKIGGTSMSQFGDVLNNVIKGNRQEKDFFNRILVVSAYGGVTNWLLEHKKSKEAENKKENALLLDSDLGLGLYFLGFSDDVDIREQISHALRIRSALLPLQAGETKIWQWALGARYSLLVVQDGSSL